MATPTADFCRLCGSNLPKKQRKTIFSETFRVESQLANVLGYVAREDDGNGKYVCFSCYGKLNTLSKIDFDLKTKMSTLRNSRETLLNELKSKCIPPSKGSINTDNTSTTSLPSTPARAPSLPIASTPSKAPNTPSRAVFKRTIIHTPTPRKPKKLFSKDSTPGPAKPSEGSSATGTCSSSISRSRKRLGEKLLSPNKAKVVFRSGTETRNRTRIITEKGWYHILVSLVRGATKKTVANKIMKMTDLKAYIIQNICKEINKECKELCSSKFPSILRQIGVKDISSVLLNDIKEEVQKRAPIFSDFILAALNKKSKSNTLQKKLTEAFVYALILRLRSKDMSRVQHAIGQILDLGGATDECIKLLSQVGVSVGPSAMQYKQNELVKRQKDKIKLTIGKQVQQEELIDKVGKLKAVASLLEHEETTNSNVANYLGRSVAPSTCTTVSDQYFNMCDSLKTAERSSFTSSFHSDLSVTDSKSYMSCNSNDISSCSSEFAYYNDQSMFNATSQATSGVTLHHCQKFIEESNKEVESIIPAYEIIGDNLDISKSPSQMSKDKQKSSFHWFLNVAVQRRVVSNLPDNAPVADITSIPNSAFVIVVEY